MNEVKLVSHGDESEIVYIARVSSSQDNTDPGLLGYLIKHNHWSPFEMVNATLEFNTTRDIGRQILRHRSFSFQEFSQRYAAVNTAIFEHREFRLKGTTNRQGSTANTTHEFDKRVAEINRTVAKLYEDMVADGVALECARAILPEGLTPTRMYMQGTLRSWIHYLRERMKWDDKNDRPFAQLEHYRLACQAHSLIAEAFPVVFEALLQLNYVDAPREA